MSKPKERKRSSPSSSSDAADAHRPKKEPRVASMDPGSDIEAGTIKIFNLNVNGLLKAFSRRNKRLAALLREQNPDIVVFTETHYDPGAPLNVKPDGMAGYQAFLSSYPFSYIGVNPANASAAGVGVYSRIKPLSVTKTGLPTHKDAKSTKGRYVVYEFATFYLVAVYVPHSGNSVKEDAHVRRKAWDVALKEELCRLDRIQSVILVGDQNVAPEDRDVYLATAKHKQKVVSGCILPHEREGWRSLLAGDGDDHTFVDVWRELHPDSDKVFTHTAADGSLNLYSGFRLDHFVVSKRILDHVQECEILSIEKALSDHIPITMTIRTPDLPTA